MKNIFRQIIRTYLDPALDLRVRLFNVLAIGGTAISLVIAGLGALNNSGVWNIVFNLIVAALSFMLLTYSRMTGRYQVCYIVTIIGIFTGLFPVLFFSAGGYHSGMPSFFVFAVAFTIFMLEGKKAVFFSAGELLLYVVICLAAYHRPDYVRHFLTEQEILTDIIIGFTSVSVIIGVCLYIHFRLYNEQQKKLDEQNDMLTRTNRAKTEFLSNASHEMRTPLTVISVNVQTVLDILEDIDALDSDAEGLLENAQEEIMRLARMVGGMLTLASMSESTDRQTLDLSSLLTSGAEMLRLHLRKRGNTLITEIEPDLRVFGNADLLAQVTSNLLTNAGTHTENGTITLKTARKGSEITVTVSDTGSGIARELLPHVFERGVSTGGTGFGLYLCKTVVESHGGVIWIDSEPGKGTAAAYSLPAYEGQFGGYGNE
ncbi:MAG: HAMP domain-containing histidine kinase [Clostridiales bacterium]|jgi:signal transduction histidine kinase|nr:HAMP domain-containing histidine kinase [Clostridiales bacterium]